jgi:hypothetical protein
MTALLLLLDTDSDRIREISEHAIAHKLKFEVVSSLTELKKRVKKESPDVIFIGYECINSTLDFLQNYYTLVYGETIDTDSKLKLYQQSVSRVVEWKSGNARLLFQFYHNFMFRKSEFKPVLQNYVTFGTLNSTLLREILLNGLLEKKNFSLKLKTNIGLSKLKICQGEIVDISCNGNNNLDVTLTILQEQQGVFRMKSFTKGEEIVSHSPSTFGILIEANFQLNLLNEFVKKFGVKNPVFRKSPQYNSDNFNVDENSFLEFASEIKEFNKILQNSPYSRLKTVRYLEKLYQEGAISFDMDQPVGLSFTQEDKYFIRDRIFNRGQKEGRLLVLGYPDSGKSQLIETLAKAHQGSVKTIQSVEYSTLQLENDLTLITIGISVDSYFQPVMKKVASDILACFFIIDYRNRDNVEYTKYLIEQMLSKYSVPLVFALTNITGDITKVIFETRKIYEIPSTFEILSLNPYEFPQIKQLFYHLQDNTSA